MGPSDESPTSITNIGEAAHICAASPGGRRYIEAMTPAERSHIDNGIWLCANHARLIDRDEALYTVEYLRRIKREHEAACAERLSGARSAQSSGDLLAIGPDIVLLGDLREVGGREWLLHAHHFVQGDLKKLTDYINQFERIPDGDRYVLVNALGDGRVLSAAPTWTKDGTDSYQLRCPIEARFPRIRAQDLGSQWAMSPETNDLFLKGRNIARVAGLDSLPQVIRQCLSTLRGESPFHPSFGSRLVEYFQALRGTPWFARSVKLEAIRQCAIPYRDEVGKRSYTPLHCVERVWGVDVLSDEVVKRRLPMRMDFDVNGVGRWQCEVAILVELTRMGDRAG